MFQVGDKVAYGIHGICQILDVEERKVDGKIRSYFALEPMNQPGSRYYIPVDNPAAVAKLRHIISPEGLEELLHSPQVHTDCWIEPENSRKQRYRELISSCDRAELLQMISSIYRHKKEQVALGRKLHLCDENFLRDAEKLLNAEFSLVLGIEPSEVKTYIGNIFG